MMQDHYRRAPRRVYRGLSGLPNDGCPGAGAELQPRMFMMVEPNVIASEGGVQIMGDDWIWGP